MKDDELVPFLIQLPRPSFFTMDRGWYMRSLLHARYFVAVLEVPDNEAAGVMRRILKHPDFSTQAGRLGKVIRASHGGMTGWKIGANLRFNGPGCDTDSIISALMSVRSFAIMVDERLFWLDG